jgi:PAS domain S-box-containing protein
LTKAEQRQPSQDETFSIYLFRKQQEEGGSDGNSDVLGYMAFQQTLQDARRFDEATTKYQLMFWDELLKDKTDIGRLNDIATLINTAMVSAQDSFRKLVKMNPNSTQVLRMYASFLIEIANESASGQKLIARADELEDQNTKTHGADNDESALFDDRNALVSISAEAKTLGAIVSANAGAVRMLGYSRADLVGRNIAMIMPAPFSNAHQSYLTRYLETGEARILNRSRIVFGSHRSGWIMPLDLFVREVSSPEGMTFLSVLRKPTSIALSQIVPAALREEKVHFRIFASRHFLSLCSFFHMHTHTHASVLFSNSTVHFLCA